MTIWLNADSRILIQGMTGSEGTKHTRRMTASGARVVAGVTPGKAGQDVDGIPVFNDVREAMMATGANVSVVFVPPRFARAAVEEANLGDRPLAVTQPFGDERVGVEGQPLIEIEAIEGPFDKHGCAFLIPPLPSGHESDHGLARDRLERQRFDP